ncbi:UDP-2,3-diacylglucosamine diphosphatase LpxI [Aquamicrobium sp. LC103]|uniref:LpxI family protein n=1 Tax=Aquamicrobium sp. LC103 TaxID=1120658 RepID=UPI000AA6941B|nr:UDP-2,3-diacylglucosamine diphosphatase LpxI [Aquamicrobium sp. LC103]
MASRIDETPPRQSSAPQRIAVVAGSGSLPIDVAAELVRTGRSPLLVLLEGEAEILAKFPPCEHFTMPLEHLGELVPRLKKQRVTHLVLAGGVERRPPLRKIRWSLDLFRLAPRLITAFARGDDGLLRALIDHIEANGIRVIGAHEIVPNLLAREGAMTITRPLARDKADIVAAMQAARAIGELDIGQAAIAIGGRAVALEGIEGTDGLLARMKPLRGNGRIAGKDRGVLAKCSKPGQELRADLPAIGPQTIEAAHAAGLAGVAVETGRSFVLDYKHTIERANDLGLFVIGVPRDKS